QQVFALEDQRDGKIIVYSEDVLAQSMKAGIVTSPQKGAAGHGVGGASGQAIQIEALTAQNTPNPSPFYKHMLGWNRKALRITLPIGASEHAIKATEQICALSAQRWREALAS